MYEKLAHVVLGSVALAISAGMPLLGGIFFCWRISPAATQFEMQLCVELLLLGGLLQEEIRGSKEQGFERLVIWAVRSFLGTVGFIICVQVAFFTLEYAFWAETIGLKGSTFLPFICGVVGWGAASAAVTTGK